MKAILLVSHGSRLSATKDEVVNLAGKIKAKCGKNIVEYAFLEIESPGIPEGIVSCISKGAKEIVVLLNFLNSGRHVLEDIPRIVQSTASKYPDVSIKITPPVGQHQKIVDLFLEMIS